MAKVIVVGAGTIGKPLVKRLVAEGHEVRVVSRTKPDMSKLPSTVEWVEAPKGAAAMEDVLDSCCDAADAAFLTIPTSDNQNDRGTIALNYMRYFAGKGLLVITAEKGTSAYHFDKIRPYLKQGIVGCYATVGGGMLLIPKMKLHRLHDKHLMIHGVFNATLNYIMTGVAAGRSLVTVCEEAADLGYAEPSEKVDPVSIFRGEIKDVRLKLCAFYNHVLSNGNGQYLKPEQFDPISEIEWQSLVDITDSNRRSRYVVSIWNGEAPHLPHGGKGWLHAKLGAWTFDARFVDLNRGSPLDDFLPSGVDNCIKVQNVATGNGPYREMGPGAGKTPTVDALMTNFDQLYELRQRTH